MRCAWGHIPPGMTEKDDQGESVAQRSGANKASQTHFKRATKEREGGIHKVWLLYLMNPGVVNRVRKNS